MTRKDYRIYRTCEADFDRAAAELADRAAADGGTILRIVFFGYATDNDDHIARRDTARRICAERFGAEGPLVGFIAQKPLRSSLAAEATVLAEPSKIVRHEDYTVIDGREIVSGELQADLTLDIGRQADAVFRRMAEILAAEGFAATDIARQWNYIERITRMAPEGQHYQMFNDARSRFYDRCEWPDGYPAATGIGARTGGASVMFDAVREAETDIPIDNPLQVAAHAYSQKVLIDRPENRGKTTPKFERARYIADRGEAAIYISGTAAIRGEESCQRHRGTDRPDDGQHRNARRRGESRPSRNRGIRQARLRSVTCIHQTRRRRGGGGALDERELPPHPDALSLGRYMPRGAVGGDRGNCAPEKNRLFADSGGVRQQSAARGGGELPTSTSDVEISRS